LTPLVGVKGACKAMGMSRATCYRHGRAGPPAAPGRPERVRKERRRPRTQPRKLGAGERREAMAVLCSPRFVDASPAQVVWTLADEGRYIASERTFYRLLRENLGEIIERRNQLRHPAYAAPELLATAPNQVWSWDISKLKGPASFNSYHLYSILDIYSRYTVGWTVMPREDSEIARELIAQAAMQQSIEPGQLTVHADRGPSMRSRPVAELLADLGVDKTHSRPYTSTDNPFSESQFKTLKYRPEFPDRFESLGHARDHSRVFFPWYNQVHRHSGIAMMNPARGALRLRRGDARSSPRGARRCLRSPPRAVREGSATGADSARSRLDQSAVKDRDARGRRGSLISPQRVSHSRWQAPFEALCLGLE